MKMLSAIVAVGVLALVGIFTWNTLNPDSSDNNLRNQGPEYGIGGGPGVSLNQTTVDESVSLNTLFQEHSLAASFHIQNLYDEKDITETSSRLQNNSVNIANFFEQKIGVDKSEFLNHWDEHIKEYENYTRALKNNDRNGTAIARNNLSHHAMMMGKAINRVHPNIPVSEVERLANEHTDLTLSIIEAHARGDTAQKVTQSTKASAQAVAFADALIDAIEGDTD